MKKILFAASECVPFIKTGGLADVVGSLPKCFDKEKYDVRVMIPNYMCIDQKWKEKMTYVDHFYAGEDSTLELWKWNMKELNSTSLIMNIIFQERDHTVIQDMI